MLKHYESPTVVPASSLAEGVFAASGVTASNNGAPGCNSKYMAGTYVKPDYSNWAAGEQRSYYRQFGCHGCPAFRDNGCGLQSDYIASGYASSYDVDDGNRMPKWEKKGYDPNDPVTDWDC